MPFLRLQVSQYIVKDEQNPCYWLWVRVQRCEGGRDMGVRSITHWSIGTE